MARHGQGSLVGRKGSVAPPNPAEKDTSRSPAEPPTLGLPLCVTALADILVLFCQNACQFCGKLQKLCRIFFPRSFCGDFLPRPFGLCIVGRHHRPPSVEASYNTGVKKGMFAAGRNNTKIPLPHLPDLSAPIRRLRPLRLTPSQPGLSTATSSARPGLPRSAKRPAAPSCRASPADHSVSP